MDPNENLREQLALAESIVADEYEVDAGDAERLAELVLALHGWLSNAGALPEDWER